MIELSQPEVRQEGLQLIFSGFIPTNLLLLIVVVRVSMPMVILFLLRHSLGQLN